MFLASAREMPDDNDAKVQCGVLAGQVRPQYLARDKKEHAALEAAGWHVIVIWECEVKKRLPALASEIKGDGQ